MESTYMLYMHISPSGKVYIGVTKHKLAIRWRNGNGYRGNEYFFRAIRKYGWDNFQHEILAEGLSYEDASNMEFDLIAIHNATNMNCGYNLRPGGCMCTHSEETRRKMSIARTGMKSSPETCAAISIACTGRKRSPETRLKMSIAKMGHKNSVGRKASPETKLKMSIAHMGNNGHTGMKASPEARAAMSKACTRKKPVEQIDLNGNVVAMFYSLVAAANSVNAFPQHIGQVCRGITLTCRGYKWRYTS